MEQLAHSLQNLKKIKEHLRDYHHQVHPILSAGSEKTPPQSAELAVIYNLLATLNKSMTKELDSMALHLHALPARPKSHVVVEHLSAREREVLLLLAKGCSYQDVTELIGCTTATTQTYVKRIYKKLKVHSRSEAVFEAASLGLININR